MRAVLDANVVVRSLFDADGEAAAWLARVGDDAFVASVPDLIFAEVGQALIGYVRRGELSVENARDHVDLVSALPLGVWPTQELVPGAIGVASETGLSVYDACYAVLAEAEDAVLVTADRRLAESVPRAELV